MNLLDIVFCMAMYACTVVVFSCVAALITCHETRKHPTYCQIQTNNIYVVYKYIKYRTGGDYEALRFKRESNKWIYIKTKPLFNVKNYAIAVIPALVILITVIVKFGFMMGLCFGGLALMTFLCICYVIHKRKIWCCKRYLMKHYKFSGIL